jgi:TRAP-type mannitol/chloroaromatic compound transport system substrate-binding protein
VSKKSSGSKLVSFIAAIAVASLMVPGSAPATAQTKTLKMQSSFPANSTAQDAAKMLAERVDKLTGGGLKLDMAPGGQIVPPFEVLDATHKKVLDGAVSIDYYWVGKNKAFTLFSNTPAGIVGLDYLDFFGWFYEGGGQALYEELLQKEMKLNVVAYPLYGPGPQALGWFRKPIESLAQFRGIKCRQTGITAEIYAKMGMAVVNMPGGEIAPAAERGAIDCAEWVGGVEDLRLGLQNIWKNHYTPGLHEVAPVANVMFNKEVWDGLSAPQKEIVKSAATEVFMRWAAWWQKLNADAIDEMQSKHGVKILQTPPEINVEFLKAWDAVAQAESEKNPFFKKVYESQKAYGAKVVPAKRFMFPPYTLTADHYFPPKL